LLVLDRVPARQRARFHERRPLRIGCPLRVDFEDRAAFLGEAVAERLPEGRPLVEVAVEDGPARRVVQGQSTGGAPPQHGGRRRWLTLIAPKVTLDLPAVARLEAAPGPGLQHG